MLGVLPSGDGINDGINLYSKGHALMKQGLQTIVKVLFPAPYLSMTYASC